MLNKKIRDGDFVMIRVGNHKGKVVKVLKVFDRCIGKFKISFVKVDNIFIKRCVKKNAGNKGSITEKNLTLNISKVSFIRKVDNIMSKIGYRTDDLGNKVRFLKKDSSII